MSKIALLKGGNGSESEISLMTADACKYAFKKMGFNYLDINIKEDKIDEREEYFDINKMINHETPKTKANSNDTPRIIPK